VNTGAELLLVEGVPAPALRVNGVQLASAYAPVEEAELAAALVPDDATEATVYGLAQGLLPRVLLGRDELERVRVVLLSRTVAAAAFRFVELFDWLDDPRVELVAATPETALQTPFAVAAAELRLAEPDAWRVRDEVLLELATPFIRRRLAAATGAGDAQIEANRALLATDGDVAQLFATRTAGRVRVAASGPTLSDHYAELRANEELLIAVDTAVGPLLAAGVVPDVVVTVDGNESSLARVFDFGLEPLAATTLVYFPISPHAVVGRWPGPRLAAYGEEERYRALARELPRATLWCSGSVLHAAVDLAVRMGAHTVDLLGADFATPRERSHVDGMPWQKELASDATRPRVLDGHGRAVPSMRNLLGYLRDFERYVAAHPGIDFVNASRDGARIRGTRYREEQHAA